MPTARLEPGTLVGQYELVRLLGRGGMGVVYEAEHRLLRRRVAIKVLHARSADAAGAAVAKQRFMREGQAAAQVRHPHVVDVFDFGMHDDLPFLVMELVDGEPLSALLGRESKLPLARTVDVLLPILSAVAELHSAGIIHRDLKPANILLQRGRGGELSPKVADFGVSRVDDGTPPITQSGVLLGTLEYMSPEQTRSTKEATERCDQYALGVMLYECVTGTKPFTGDTPYALMHAVVTAPVAPPSAGDAGLPRAFDDVVLRAMHRDPSRRFASVDELAEAILPFASRDVAARWSADFVPSSSTAMTLAQDGVASGESARRRSSKRLAIAASAVFVAAAAILGIALREGGAPGAHARVVPTAPALSTAAPPIVTSATVSAPRDAPPVAEHRAAPQPAPAPSKDHARAASRGATRAPIVQTPSHTPPTLLGPTIGDNGAPVLDVP